jgi:hypothetical protein
MENPASWGDAEKVIDAAIRKWEEWWRKQGYVGASFAAFIADELRNAGLLDNEHEVWEAGYAAAQEVVDFEDIKVYAHQVFPSDYNGNPYPPSK